MAEETVSPARSKHTVSARQKTALAVVLGALVAMAPSFFSYLQARQEIREKYKQGRDEAAHSYETLVTSVTDLQKAMLAQHDYVVKLEGQIVVLTTFLGQLSPGLRMGVAPILPTLVAPPIRPELPAPPDFDAVQMKR